MVLIVDDLGDFGDHVAAALDLHPIANLHAQAPDLIHVVQRGIADGRAPNRNRGQLGHRRQFPGAANLPAHVLELGDSRAGSVLVGDRPARSLAGKAEFVLQAGAIDFDDDAVNLVRQRIPLPLPRLDERPHFVHRMHKLVVRVDLESSRIERAQCLRVAVEIRTAALKQDVGEKIHAPFRRDVRIQLANCAGREIARIGERRQPVLFPFLIDLLERRGGHEQLAAHLKVGWNASLLQPLFRDRQRDRAHGAHVERDIFADRSVAARHAARQFAILIDQRQRHAVEFQFADVVHIAATGKFVDAPFPVAQFFLVVGVVERQHG